jgi:hypothetical protein
MHPIQGAIMFRRSCHRLFVIVLLGIYAALASGCGKSVLIGSENYHGFTADSLRAHGAVVVGVGDDTGEAWQKNMLTRKFHESVMKDYAGFWSSSPSDVRSAMGEGEYEALLAHFTDKGELSGDRVRRLAALRMDGRYAVLGRLRIDQLWYSRSATEGQIYDEHSKEYRKAPGYDYQIERKITVEVVAYDLTIGSMVWKGARNASEKSNRFQQDVRAEWEQEGEAEQQEEGGFWACLSLLDIFFGDDETSTPDEEELKYYPDPPGLEVVAGKIFDDFAEDLTGFDD